MPEFFRARMGSMKNRKFSTPMMKQYAAIKKQYADCLLFFRLGDFYELFLDDAKIGAAVLDIVLTKRPRGKDGHIPMAGVPYHAADSYIAKLVKAGHKVAICEQVSEPDNRGIVDREVVRIVTSGTVMDEKVLEQKRNNYVMTISIGKNVIGIAVADISTGDFQATELPFSDTPAQVLDAEITRFTPSECIVSEKEYNNPKTLQILARHGNVNTSYFAATDSSSDILKRHFKVRSLAAFDIAGKENAIAAAALLIEYISHTQLGKISHLQSIKVLADDSRMVLDRSTIANLELVDPMHGDSENATLLSVIDQTKSAMGGRLMREWILEPLVDRRYINARLTAVALLIADWEKRRKIRKLLVNVCDIERIVGRLSTGLATPVDLVNLKSSLLIAMELGDLVKGIDTQLARAVVKAISPKLQTMTESIHTVIKNNPPIDPKNGGVIKRGADSKLDKLQKNISGSKKWIAKLENRERERTDIGSLKVKFNKVFGYYIEVSKPNASAVPDNYIRKQTMVNAERFITPELKVYEEKVLLAEGDIHAREYELFLALTKEVLGQTALLRKAAKAVAVLDCITSFAEVAEKNGYIKPEITNKKEIKITEGKHPVVEKALGAGKFVPNSTLLDSKKNQLHIITGPNMAGKSVYMRQVALIVLMSQIGCFVPASKAEIGIVDKLFVRSGAGDAIASGLSTFMLEMVETAHILNHATDRSLVILDEIGRGTSTYDGISIAWAVTEYLVKGDAKPKTLFATHYHELQALEKEYPNSISNYQVTVKETAGDPVFLHKVVRGKASHSYGVNVAKLAGVPNVVTVRSAEVLEKLEQSDEKPEAQKKPKKEPAENKLAKELAKIDLNEMTPLAALNKLAKLKRLADDTN